MGINEKKLDEALVEYPTVKLVWHPFLVQCKCFYHMRLVTFLLHTIPAYLADAFLMCTGKERTVVKMYTKIQNVIEKLEYFSAKLFLFKSENIGRMLDNMSPRDRTYSFVT
ncbi:unnamed protein product [Callosobruchus maculatus]|uniref:Fatty acyl-CoA reductase C-terminal domain-containing protein n=1 Tax=Callosobruchus maculatus TaxID=64391 RepID=A0A653DPD6_CALMS|nr:unnamed protein product [Callosobruchus maculatus]